MNKRGKAIRKKLRLMFHKHYIKYRKPEVNARIEALKAAGWKVRDLMVGGLSLSKKFDRKAQCWPPGCTHSLKCYSPEDVESTIADAEALEASTC